MPEDIVVWKDSEYTINTPLDRLIQVRAELKIASNKAYAQERKWRETSQDLNQLRETIELIIKRRVDETTDMYIKSNQMSDSLG